LGEKGITWRRHSYDFEIEVDEVLEFVESVSRKPFAKAVVLSVKNTAFAEMTKEDKSGHEKFASDKEMYETYSRYFGQKVAEETPLKVIKFKLIERH